MSKHDFGELRSLLDGEQDRAHFNTIFALIEKAVLDSLDQATQDVIPYVKERLASWTAESKRLDEEVTLRLTKHRARVRSALLGLVEPTSFIEDAVSAIAKKDADELIVQHNLSDVLEGAILGGPEPEPGHFARYLEYNGVDFIAEGSQRIEWELEDWFQRAGWTEYEDEQAQLKAYEKAKSTYKDAVLERLDDRQEELEEKIFERVWG